MNTEHLTPEQILDKHLHCEAGTDEIISAMEEYAAQQVEQQTKQLREERDMAIILLRRMIASCDGYPEVLEGCSLELNINNFFNQLNKKNEG